MKAIVTGPAGQDGYYMVQRLMQDGVEVLGLTSNLSKANAEFKGSDERHLRLVEFDYALVGGFKDILDVYAPDLIFNFAAKAIGQGMFDEPFELSRLNGTFVLDILEAIRKSPRRDKIVFCQSSSSEMYGRVTEAPQSEDTPLRPKSPYGAAKAYAHNLLNIYRAYHDVKCCAAILYNHESIRRSARFVTKKIATGAASIKLGLTRSLALGSLDARRDWGYAPEYVDAMVRMGVANSAEDYVVATGQLSSVRDLCEAAFGCIGLDYREFVEMNKDDFRVTESVNLVGNPTKINQRLGWKARKSPKDIMIELVEYELARLKNN